MTADINKRYQEIISKCKFISKPNEWFVGGTEAKCSGACSYSDFKNGDKFNSGWSLFEGYTNEIYIGFKGELPRPDGEICSFDEFLIYDKYGNEISELTLNEYMNLISSNIIEKFINRLNKININVKLVANYPWIYIDEINNKKVIETFQADHGFTIALTPIKKDESLQFTNITEIFKLIRKYC